jgi:Transposase
MINSRAWFVGVDWASENHHVRVCDCHGKRIGERVFAHGGGGIADMSTWLSNATGADPGEIHVAIEVPHGPVVEALLERSFNVYAINPKQLDRFRDRFSPAGAKDDSRDAEVLADALRTDMHAFRKLALAEPLLIELREWSRMTDDLTAERNRLGNRMREQLWRYFPAMLELEDDMTAAWFLGLWELAPRPDKARRLRQGAIAKLLKDHRIRRLDATEVLTALRKPAVSVAPGTVEAATAHIGSLIPRMRLVNRQIKEAHTEIDLGNWPSRRKPNRGNLVSSATRRSSHPCQETAGSSWPRCSQKAGSPCNAETTTLCELFVALPQSPAAPARAGL